MLLRVFYDSFTFLVLADPGIPKQNPESRKMVVVVVMMQCKAMML